MEQLIEPKKYMINSSLRLLQERLQREAPALEWECGPVPGAPMLLGTNLPEEIQIDARSNGLPVKGSPFYLSGECLLRWGCDASATLISNELTPSIHAYQHRMALDWDRLAEI